MSFEIVQGIINKFVDVDSEWLLTGKGEMFKSGNNSVLSENEQGIPLIPIDAMAGFGTGGSQIMEYDTKRYKVPEFEELKAEFMIKVRGDSMSPKYTSRDLLACRKITMAFFQWNNIYVLDTSQGALVKRIRESKKEGHVLCVSENEDYAQFDLLIEEINTIAIVLGVIRFE